VVKRELQKGKTSDLTAVERANETADWGKIAAKYQRPSQWRAAWQIANSPGPYAALWYLIYLSLGVSWDYIAAALQGASLYVPVCFDFKGPKATNAI
jgi:hypothetical protein